MVHARVADGVAVRDDEPLEAALRPQPPVLGAVVQAGGHAVDGVVRTHHLNDGGGGGGGGNGGGDGGGGGGGGCMMIGERTKDKRSERWWWWLWLWW